MCHWTTLKKKRLKWQILSLLWLSQIFLKGGNCNFKKGKLAILKKGNCDFPGGPLVKTSPYNVGSIPGRGAKIPHAAAKSLHPVAKDPACPTK